MSSIPRKFLVYVTFTTLSGQVLAFSPPMPPTSPILITGGGSQNTGECLLPNPVLKKVMYQKPYAITPNSCENISETQTRTCIGGGYSKWSGEFHYPQCAVVSSQTADGTLWDMDSIEYVGGYRISGSPFGPDSSYSADFSFGTFTVAEDGQSIYIVGNSNESRIAEFEIPAITNTKNPAMMEKAENILQDFTLLNDPGGRHDPGISAYFRVTGMLELQGHLIVNYFNWYEANGTEVDTTSVFVDSSNLETSNIVGPYQLEGAAHSAGWISPIPLNWQERLGGTHLSGWSQGSINSRLSNGPSAFFWNPYETVIDNYVPQSVPSTTGLDFPLDNILFDKDLYGNIYDGTFSANEYVMLNEDKRNTLWTYLSGASYGFIIPDTNTYVTLGFNGGMSSGIGYKWQREDGSYCSGHCPKDPDDMSNYYWLWKVSDLEKVANGDIAPHSVRPYDFGVFDTLGLDARLAGGFFDPSTGKLTVSLREGDATSTYRRPPLFLVYQIGN